jgi:hypothetical protein
LLIKDISGAMSDKNQDLSGKVDGVYEMTKKEKSSQQISR